MLTTAIFYEALDSVGHLKGTELKKQVSFNEVLKSNNVLNTFTVVSTRTK
jgi:hypothetical protein